MFTDEFLSGSGFKSDGRKKYGSDEEEEDNDMLDIKTNNFDLNATFEELNVVDNVVPFKANSQQWRLQQPNNSADRPIGMAPFVPQMDPYDPIERPRDYSNFKHFRNRSHFNNSNNNQNNYNNNRRNNNNNNNYNSNNNRRNPNNFNRNNNNYNNNSINRNNRRPINYNRNDNFIKEQVRNISYDNRNPDTNFTVTSNLTLTSPSAQLVEAQNLIAKSKVTPGDMGVIASAMMAILRGNGAAPPPQPVQKYDMTVQKEIHAMQVRI